MTPDQKLMEQETTIRWDGTDAPAVLWTAVSAIRREWESYGFPVTPTQGGWRAEVTKDRIAYKTVTSTGKQKKAPNR